MDQIAEQNYHVLPITDRHTYSGSERSEDIGLLAEALGKAQGQMRSAPKNKTNPHLKSKYADLASVIDAARDALAKNGLSFVQLVDTEQAKIVCHTELLHSSGQWIRGRLVVHAAQSGIQQIGAAITYAKRYALSAMLGIASDEEDDGEADQAKATAKETNGKYKQISVSDPQPVDPKTAAKNEKKAKSHPELVAQAQQTFPESTVLGDNTQPASDQLKGRMWDRCRALWPTGTKDACDAALKASKLKPIDWKTATVSDCETLSNVLNELEANTGEGAPM